MSAMLHNEARKLILEGYDKGYQRKGTGKVLFCKRLFDLSFAEASERNRKLRNSDESPWKEAQIVRCRSPAHPFTSGETVGYHLSGDH